MDEKFCGTPECPDENTPSPNENTLLQEELTEENAAETAEKMEVPADQETDETAEDSERPAKKKKSPVIWLSIACTVLAVALCATVFYLVNGGWKIRSNDIYYRDSYTVGAADAAGKSDKIVATVGDKELNNGQLQLYYWMQVYDYLDYWGGYASYFGLDPAISLDQQIKDEKTGMTWQQYFLDVAIKTWQRYQVLNIRADAEEFELTEEFRKMLDTATENMYTMAQQNGFSSADALVQSEMGPGCDMDDYKAYLERYYRGYQYFEKEFAKLRATDEEIAEYFDAHIGDFEEMGVTKESGLVSSVRHILIAPESEETDENGQAVFTDEQWEACREKAQSLMDAWKAGEATEESFTALVADNTADGGSASNGGLYENISFNSNFVEPFKDWATDPQRKHGDCELVKTDFGYHIMYFVSGVDAWSMYAESSLMTEKSNKMVEGFIAEYPLEVNYKNIVLGEVSLAPKQ